MLMTTTTLTLSTVACEPCETARGTMYAVLGQTAAARRELTERFGLPCPNGCHIIDLDACVALTRELLRDEMHVAWVQAVTAEIAA